jgi:hypothetical protein
MTIIQVGIRNHSLVMIFVWIWKINAPKGFGNIHVLTNYFNLSTFKLLPEVKNSYKLQQIVLQIVKYFLKLYFV